MKKTQDIRLSIMSWNIYLGSDLTPILTATSEELPQRVTEVFRQFLATNFSMRAKAIASEIYRKAPDIIGLQEAALWELIPPNSNKVKFDFVDIILNILSSWGMKYKLVVENQNFKFELPDFSGNLISLKDRDVMLVRDLDHISVTKKQKDNFKTNLEFQIAGEPFTFLRGWSAIDVCIHGDIFRVVNTHLDPDLQEIQVAQANELLMGPGKTNLPLIFIGDFHSNANNGDETYENLIATGFKDTWTTAGNPIGFTYSQDFDLLNSQTTLTERIDLILFKNINNLKLVKTELVGETQANRTFTALWPSNHAGITSELIIY